MELQRILAPDTRSATDKATALFGQDVLVISNHKVNGQTELVIAVDLDAQLSLVQKDRAIRPPTDFGNQLARLQQPAGATQQTSAQEPAWRAGENERDYLRSREIVDMVRDELAAMRREFSLGRQTSAWQAGLTPTPELAPLFASLAEAGMPTGLRTLLLDTIKNMTSEQEALLAIKNQLGHSLARPSAPMPQKGIHLIAGPTGAGKTLMTARIASDAASKIGQKNVAIINYQDPRFGAWSQTQMLSAQIGSDCFRADDPDTLRLLLNELSQRSLILIDTPGVQMSARIAEVLALCPSCTCHAILPADSSSATLKRILQTSAIKWQSLMVSKVDESSQPWPLLEFMCHNSLRISIGSDGDHISNLKSDLTLDSLLCKAVANFSQVAAPAIPVSTELQVGDISSSQRVFKAGAPRGIRGPFN